MKIMASLFYAYLSFFEINDQLPLPSLCVNLEREFLHIDTAVFLTGHHDEEIDQYNQLIKAKYNVMDCKNKLSYSSKYLDREKQAYKHFQDTYKKSIRGTKMNRQAYKKAQEASKNAYFQAIHCHEFKKFLEKNADESILNDEERILLYDIKDEANKFNCFHQDSK